MIDAVNVVHVIVYHRYRDNRIRVCHGNEWETGYEN